MAKVQLKAASRLKAALDIENDPDAASKDYYTKPLDADDPDANHNPNDPDAPASNSLGLSTRMLRMGSKAKGSK